MLHHKIIEQEGTCWYVLGRDDQKSSHVIDTNEYLVSYGENALLLDPGGTEIFPRVVTAVGEVIPLDRLTALFGSHQDPDILSSLPLWMGLCPEAKIYLPRMWSGFISHFGHEYVGRFCPIPDQGMDLPLGKRLQPLQAIPAHYCHSSGNFSIFDPVTKVLFSGDLGAALLPEGQMDLFVADFQQHIKYMQGFHQRWMPSDQALKRWVRRVRALNPQFICPQHGAIFSGPHIPAFLDWLEHLEVGLVHDE